ncbi:MULTISPECIES: phosphohistidine phosphatase SixA [Undibacterium]|uniref:Phosphohistidine phosphatase SixA n=1 Tax=Undibacterium umbellatum TaxID=2762300 RepID=A0ABR6Z4P1_9BURK|nr:MULTISPECIES: phosphohistidine phosphatase SixA [Undibacterium]MBC3906717.1 phosphohistidine phosphatase SixA [Undibacterium umbellatum]MDP1979724.1 phosphohistidine phosphatase SixA [Undibacterium sp.]
MDLILWRHAEAEPATAELTDEFRKLTGKGNKQASKIAYWLDSTLPETCRILASPTIRTRDTAEALIACGRKYKIMPELGPAATVSDVLTAANWPNSREPVLIIGHQPYLGQVAAELLGHPLQEYGVRKGNVWWITQKQRENEVVQTYLKAIMSPDLVVK